MKLSRIAMVTALFATAPAAFAASTTDVTVTGTITPAACTPSLAGGGNFDLGRISAQDLRPGGTGLPTQVKSLGVVCDAPTRFALRAVDGRAGTDTNPNEYTFGLGSSGSEKIGRYTMRLTNYIADGSSQVVGVVSDNGGGRWFVYRDYIHNTNQPWLLSVAAAGQTEPLAMSVLSASLNLKAVIAPTTELTLTEDIQIDGASTIELVYL